MGPQEKLQTVLRNTLYTCALGAPNKVVDVEKTQNWILEVRKRENNSTIYNQNLNSKWYLTPSATPPHVNIYHRFSDQPFATNTSIEGLEKNKWLRLTLQKALITQRSRLGNCSDRAALIAQQLWSKNFPEIFRIEIAQPKEFDHNIVIVNRKQGSDIANPKEWDAYIIEAWRDESAVYHSDEFDEQMGKTFLFGEYQDFKFWQKGYGITPLHLSQLPFLAKYSINLLLKKIGLNFSFLERLLNARFQMDFFVEILPQKMPYPYDLTTGLPFEDNYEISPYPLELYSNKREKTNWREKANQEKDSHKAKFSDCLEEIRSKYTASI